MRFSILSSIGGDRNLIQTKCRNYPGVRQIPVMMLVDGFCFHYSNENTPDHSHFALVLSSFFVDNCWIQQISRVASD